MAHGLRRLRDTWQRNPASPGKKLKHKVKVILRMKSVKCSVCLSYPSVHPVHVLCTVDELCVVHVLHTNDAL